MKLPGFSLFIIQLCYSLGINAEWDVQRTRLDSVTGNREADDKHGHQTIIIMEEDTAVINSATYLFKRHRAASTLLRFHHQTLHVLRGNPSFSSTNHDIILVGHGSKGTTGEAHLAGYTPEEVATFVSTLEINVCTIIIISCNLGNDQNFMLRLLKVLHSVGRKVKLHLFNTLLSVSSDGQMITGNDAVWRSHDHSSRVVAHLNWRGDLVTKHILGCTGPPLPNYKGSVLYLQTLEWPSHPQMFVPLELRKKYTSIDCLEGLTWSLFFEENERRRAPPFVPGHGLKAVWLEEAGVSQESTNNLRHIRNIQDLLVEIRYNAREEVASDLYYVLNECLYKVQRRNLSVSLVGKLMSSDNKAEIEQFRENFKEKQGESSLQELQQGLKASKFNDFCRQTFQFHQCTYNCERWGQYFMAAVFSASVRNFRIFSLFLMSVIGCEVGRLRGTESSLCSAFVGDEHPMVTDEPLLDYVGRGFYGCTVENYLMAPQNTRIWLDQLVAKENALYIKSKQMMNAISEQTELDIFGRIKVMNKYVFSSYLEFFRGTPEGKKLKRGCAPLFNED